MAVFGSGIVIEDGGMTTSADAGPFTATTNQGVLPIPYLPIQGNYPVSTLGGSSGGTIAGQGGGISIF